MHGIWTHSLQFTRPMAYYLATTSYFAMYVLFRICLTLHCSSLLRLCKSSFAVLLLVQYSLGELEDLKYATCCLKRITFLNLKWQNERDTLSTHRYADDMSNCTTSLGMNAWSPVYNHLSLSLGFNTLWTLKWVLQNLSDSSLFFFIKVTYVFISSIVTCAVFP